MAQIPPEWRGQTCPHGYPLEITSECPQCKIEAEKKPLIEMKGPGYKINITEEEIDTLVDRIGMEDEAARAAIASLEQEIQKEKAPKAEIAAVEEKPAAEAPTEKKLNRLEREGKTAAQKLLEIVTGQQRAQEKQNMTQEEIARYKDMFANPKAKSVGMVYLSKEMSRMIDEMLQEEKISQTRHEDIKTNMPLMGLQYIETPTNKGAAA